MGAVRFHAPRNLRFERVPRPREPRGREAKVRIEAAGICGTDLHVYETGAYVTTVPVTMGHEFSGTVIETGEEVRSLSPGDRVVGDSRVACGECEFCGKGFPNLCASLGFIGEVREGAFAEEILLGEQSLVRIGTSVPLEMAALAEPLAVAIHAFRQAFADPQGPCRPSGTMGGSTGGGPTGSAAPGGTARACSALVLGAGPIGALLYGAARINGLENITVADISRYRRAAMEKAHPGSTADPSALPARKYDLVFETTGSGDVAESLLPRVVKKKGTLVMIGLFRSPPAFNLNALIENEWEVRGCAAFSDELGEAARLLEAHWPVFTHVVSHLLPLREFRGAFDLLLSLEKEAMKVVFQPSLT
jgi:(R,R)-butanediol dehydrogenase/meso-butanediol dehydrogenase/diacetyl reductase